MDPKLSLPPTRAETIAWALCLWVGPAIWFFFAVLFTNLYGNQIELATLPFVNIDRIVLRRLQLMVVAGMCMVPVVGGYLVWKEIFDQIGIQEYLFVGWNVIMFVVAIVCVYYRIPTIVGWKSG